MLLVIACCVLLATGIVLAVIWNGERFIPPTLGEGVREGWMSRHLAGLRLYVWWATILTVIGTATGVLVTGAGGRLVMRLLALTSPEAQYMFTEGQAVVGVISVEGTLGFLIFGAFPAAFVSALLYLLVVPWLPPGRLAGPAFGALLLVAVAPFVDPLRADNFDFDILGPGWLSVVAFSALVVLQGALLAALAGRLSRSLPLMSKQNVWRTAPPLLPAIVLVWVGVLLLVGAAVAFVLPRLLPWVLRVRASRIGVVIGRLVLVGAVLVAAPTFVASVVSIWTR